MRMSRGWAATAVLATLATSILTGSSVSASEYKASGHRTFTLVFHFSVGYEQQIDLGEPNQGGRPTAGDLLLTDHPLFDPKTGREVGSHVVRAVYVRVFPNGDALLATDTNDQLKDGLITTQGPFRFSEFQTGSTAAITGGTGAYARARGTVTAREIDPDTVQLTFNVLP